MKELFEKINLRSDRFNYINKKNLFTIDYKDVITNKNENLINNLKMSI